MYPERTSVKYLAMFTSASTHTQLFQLTKLGYHSKRKEGLARRIASICISLLTRKSGKSKVSRVRHVRESVSLSQFNHKNHRTTRIT